MASFNQFVILVDGISASVTLDAEYTPTNVVRTRIDAVTFTNYSGAVCWITVQIGAATGNDKHIIYQHNIAAGASYTAPEMIGQTINSGQSLYIQSQTASSISVRIAGTEKDS